MGHDLKVDIAKIERLKELDKIIKDADKEAKAIKKEIITCHATLNPLESINYTNGINVICVNEYYDLELDVERIEKDHPEILDNYSKLKYHAPSYKVGFSKVKGD